MNKRKYVALVGSRDAPLDDLELMIRLGRTFVDLGFDDSSGDAFGCDRAGWWGARQADRYDPHEQRIYVLHSGKNRRRAQEHGFIVAEDHPEQWLVAEHLAFEARGSWAGLPQQFQRDLHIRNCYQVYGHTMDDPVKALVYSAPVKGNPKNEFCSGGTNTALQIAKRANIPIRVNIGTAEGTAWAEEFLKKYETSKEYEEIIWSEILKPTDPRLEYL